MRLNYPIVSQPVSLAHRSWEVRCVADQDTLLQCLHTEEDLETFPFGMLLWASAIALAQRLTDEPALVIGKRVLELGAGVGLVGLVAAHLGASEVIQTDYHPDCLELCRENADRNGIRGVAVTHGDWREWPPELTGFDLVLGTDILYERSLHPTLANLLPTLGNTILLADPIRPAALEFIEHREREGWTISLESRHIQWAGEDKDTMLLWIAPRAAILSRKEGHE